MGFCQEDDPSFGYPLLVYFEDFNKEERKNNIQSSCLQDFIFPNAFRILLAIHHSWDNPYTLCMVEDMYRDFNFKKQIFFFKEYLYMDATRIIFITI